MLDIEERMILHKAIDIAAGYFVGLGHDEADARARASGYVGRLFGRGERRPLMLANRAIEQMETQAVMADEISTIDLTEIFSWPA